MLIWVSLLGVVCGCAGERQYEIKLESLITRAPAEGLVANADVELTAYNETVTCVTGYLELIGKIPPEALIGVVGYERSREDKNAYQEKPTVNYTVNICDFLDEDDTIMPELMMISNIDQTCTPKPNNYTIDCFNLEAKSLPDKVPGEDHWLFTVFLYEKNSTLSPVLAYAMATVFFDSSEYDKNHNNDNEDNENNDNNDNNDNNNNNNNNNNKNS